MTRDERYLIEAKKAMGAYRSQQRYKDFPIPGQTGYCARAARALWSAVRDGRWFPYAGIDADRDSDVDANDMMRLFIRNGRAVLTNEDGNAYHRAVGKGLLRVGSMLFFHYANFGHVVTVVEITGDPAASLKNVRVFENTSGYRGGDGPGTTITTLDRVCGPAGSGRIVAVGNYDT